MDGPEIESRWYEIFRPSRLALGAHPPSCTMGSGSFPGVKYGRAVLLTTNPLLVPRFWRSRAIPLAAVWATTGSVTGTLYLFLSTVRLELYNICVNILYFFSSKHLNANISPRPKLDHESIQGVEIELDILKSKYVIRI